MNWYKATVRISVFVYCILIMTSAVFGAVTSFQIKVPRKTASGQLQIAKLKAIVRVVNENPIKFEVENTPRNVPGKIETDFLRPSAPGTPITFRIPNPGAPAEHGDTLFIRPPDNTLPLSDPARRKYTFIFNLDSDFDALDSMFPCKNTMVADEIWTITVKSGPQIEGVSVQSLDSNIAGNKCGAQYRTVPLTEPIATVEGLPPDFQQGGRPGVDVVLVLDRSGSMQSSVLGGSSLPKIEALHTAVGFFVTEWQKMRSNEVMESASPRIVSPEDKIGIVFFDHNANWLKELVVGSPIDGLKLFSDTQRDISTHVSSVNTGGLTSIGGGLKKAAESFSPQAIQDDGNRKVILLMSDGMQNTEPNAQVTGNQVETEVGGVVTPLANQPKLQIYSVTVGDVGAIDPIINQNVATASGGFYMNTRTGEDLSTFFLELLQNFIKFSTVETFRMVSSKTHYRSPYQTTIPVTTTTQSITFNLNWNPQLGSIRLKVQPPGGVSPIIVAPGMYDIPGTLILNELLPLTGSANSGGDWVVKVETLNDSDEEIPFNLIVLGDDMALSSEQTIVTADYGTGGNIKLQARVNELEEPITGLNSQPDAKMLVQLVRPGVSIGDLLSDSTASSKPPQGSDQMTAVNAKLYNTLKENPSALSYRQDMITLLDNGNAANGDEVAGDGIYSALYPAELEGHYNFLFALEGTTKNLGRFSRQQFKTVYVRSIPDQDATEIRTNVQQTSDGNTLVINITPKTKFGHRMGPGWGNYFWFTAPGSEPFKALDNLDGTYKASLSFSGNTIPPVSIHFLRVSAVIDNSVTADKLPVSLTSGTTLVEKIPGTGIVGPSYYGFLLILAILIIIGFIVALVLRILIGP